MFIISYKMQQRIMLNIRVSTRTYSWFQKQQKIYKSTHVPL